MNFIKISNYWSPIKTAKVIILSDKDETIYGGKIFSII